MKRLLLLLPLALFSLAGCYYDKENDLYPSSNTTCVITNVSFASVIQPIVNQSCAISTCHDAATASGGVDLTTYAGVKKVADDGRLVGTVTHDPNYEPMPQGNSQLPDCKINQIKSWIADGAQNN